MLLRLGQLVAFALQVHKALFDICTSIPGARFTDILSQSFRKFHTVFMKLTKLLGLRCLVKRACKFHTVCMEFRKILGLSF